MTHKRRDARPDVGRAATPPVTPPGPLVVYYKRRGGINARLTRVLPDPVAARSTAHYLTAISPKAAHHVPDRPHHNRRLDKGTGDPAQGDPSAPGLARDTRLVVEETPDGVLLRRAPAFPPTCAEDVFARLRHSGALVSVEEMDAAVLVEARRRLDRD